MALKVENEVIIPKLPIGNLGAVANMVKKCRGIPNITSRTEDLLSANKIIIAGVGAFDAGIEALNAGGWIESLHEVATRGSAAILGICLGMQLMCRKSEEGNMEGLGWFDADVQKIDSSSSSLKVPHMGWNTIEIKKDNELIPPTEEEARFYFVHTYHVNCDNDEDILATTEYGTQLTAAISKNHIYGAQFHPEKSHRFGMQMIERFINL